MSGAGGGALAPSVPESESATYDFARVRRRAAAVHRRRGRAVNAMNILTPPGHAYQNGGKPWGS
ncbi:hypothetical protein GCM10023336_09000 [Streptomyces similanensis]|uniref:Uncharacterized protein n=1 Tax=Streptomyces similanensis TaxID=1274988 RepID=A0ABP9JXY7_9ACTN